MFRIEVKVYKTDTCTTEMENYSNAKDDSEVRQKLRLLIQAWERRKKSPRRFNIPVETVQKGAA